MKSFEVPVHYRSALVTATSREPNGEPVTVPWGAGDRLLLYTDGLSEARDDRGQFLPLLELAPALAASQPDIALDGVLERVRRHVRGGELGDDLAVVLLENTGDASHTSEHIEPPMGGEPARG